VPIFLKSFLFKTENNITAFNFFPNKLGEFKHPKVNKHSNYVGTPKQSHLILVAPSNIYWGGRNPKKKEKQNELSRTIPRETQHII
jgi:hypothetical protein